MNPAFLFVFALLGVFFAVAAYSDRNDLTPTIIIGSISAVLFLVGLFTVAFVPGTTHDEVTFNSATTEIYTFSDNAAGGNSGFITVADNTYYYYYKTSGGIKQGKIPTSSTTVEFTEETPTLQTTTKTTVRTTHYWWFFGFDDTFTDNKYTLYVPEGAFNITIQPPNPTT